MKKLKRLIYLKFARSLNKNVSDVSVPTIISHNTNIKGDIVSNAVLHIDGHVEGDITCEELVIGVKGVVDGAVNVKSFQLHGVLNGKVSAEKIFIAKTARLVGDATHRSIAIEPGAYIDGHCFRVSATVPIESAKPELKLVDTGKHRKKAS